MKDTIMEKNCLNCIRMMPILDGKKRVGQRCMANEMKVNARMVCEEWETTEKQ